ncbi:MAG: zinc ABC transporter substrate-binding protein [Planctomycetota bacterium]
MIRFHPSTALTLAACALWLCACGADPSSSPAEGTTAGVGDDSSSQPSAKLQVVCTTTMIGDIVSEIAGDLADVEVLFGPTVDPHLFRATRDDVASLLSADLVFTNGFGLEGYLQPTLKQVKETGIDLVPIAEVILDDGEAMTDADVPDPHVWMDASLWSRLPDEVAARLAAERPGDLALPETLKARARAVAERLTALDTYAEETLKTIPEASRTLVTAHDAFRYFGRRYGVRVEGIQGLSTASESGLEALERLVDLLVDSKISAVFVESTVSDRNVKALIEGAAAQGHAVTLGGTLHSDAPGAAETYEAMMRHNVDTIAEALR